MGKHFLGDYKPVNVYRNNVKLAGWTATEKTGEAISYTDTYNDKFNSLIADGAEPQSLADWHGVSGALSQVQTVQGKNLFDINNPTEIGLWYEPSNGTRIANVLLNTYKLKNISVGQIYTFSSSDNATSIRVTYFTSAGIFVSGGVLKLAGWETFMVTVPANATYAQISYYATRTILQIELGSTATPYEPYVPNSPSPDYPSPVTPNILAGSYKIARPAGGWWTITLADDIRGISTYTDKVNLDLLTGKGKLRKKISKKVFDGSEGLRIGNPASYDGANSTDRFYNPQALCFGNSSSLSEYCTHLQHVNSVWGSDSLTGGVSINSPTGTDNQIHIRIPNSIAGIITADTSEQRTTKILTWLAAQYTAGTPVTVYYVLATETVTDLTLTHTDTSDLPELTLADLGITVSSLDYPFTIYESNNNLISISNATEVKQTVSLPTLRAISTVKDRYDILTGVKAKKISEWINPADYAMTATPQTGYMQMFTPTISGALANSAIHGYKYNGAKLGNGMAAIDYGKVHTDGTICITAAPADTGWGVTPTAAETKAYFLGWMMCNADGTAPYLSGTKNWKHITDGAGLTATLPTATYAGYTPYRLLYQLATPVDEQLTGVNVPTYPWHTDIAQKGDALTTITANAKVMD